jgi:NAD-dependent dihydropyrimidine dehydrogenase PreA subunit
MKIAVTSSGPDLDADIDPRFGGCPYFVLIDTESGAAETLTKYIDCDVEAPNGHLFLRLEIRERTSVGILVPRIDPDLFTLCVDCAELCEFNALAVSRNRVMVFPELCHGCGVCSWVCPEEGAITEIQRRIGEVALGEVTSEDGPIAFAQGSLDIGEHSPVPVIAAAKRCAREERTLVLDAPPGTASMPSTWTSTKAISSIPWPVSTAGSAPWSVRKRRSRWKCSWMVPRGISPLALSL